MQKAEEVGAGFTDVFACPCRSEFILYAKKKKKQKKKKKKKKKQKKKKKGGRRNEEVNPNLWDLYPPANARSNPTTHSLC